MQGETFGSNIFLIYCPALLPKGYTPAPRETEADLSGEVRTLNRRLKTRVYLTVEESSGNGQSYWGFPVTWVKEDETLLDASKRALIERVGPLELYCPSNCPMAVNVSPYSKEKQKETGKFGAKTFFMKLQYDSGDVNPSVMKAKDFAWLARDEVVEKIRAQSGEFQSKLYHYLL
jgi:large subunit ribosomal protein L46